jgi:hypothetical protein
LNSLRAALTLPKEGKETRGGAFIEDTFIATRALDHEGKV